MDKCREMLEQTIEKKLEVISENDADMSEKDYDNFFKLYDIKLAEDKNQSEKKDKKVERILKTGLDVMGIVVPVAFYSLWMNKGFKFEETGSYSSTTFRNLIGNFKPKK